MATRGGAGAGGFYRWPRWGVVADGTWTRWSKGAPWGGGTVVCNPGGPLAHSTVNNYSFTVNIAIAKVTRLNS